MANRTVIIIASLVGAGLLVVGAAAYALRPTAAPSGEFTPIPVEATEAEPVALPTTGDEAEIVVSAIQTFHIDTSQSEARFEIGEILNGSFNLVIGVSDQVAGEILIDVANPANSQIGVVQINARAFVTDSGLRNRAINNNILQTQAYEFITFIPTAIVGMPETAAVGDTLNFQVVGDLTIRDITEEVTFDLVVNVVAEDRLEGEATATIQRGDYQLTIPQVPSVASVDEELVLAFDFVAVP